MKYKNGQHYICQDYTLHSSLAGTFFKSEQGFPGWVDNVMKVKK